MSVNPIKVDWFDLGLASTVGSGLYAAVTQETTAAIVTMLMTIGFASVAIYQRYRSTRRQEDVADEIAHKDSLTIQLAAIREQAEIERVARLKAEEESSTTRRELVSALQHLAVVVPGLACPAAQDGRARCGDSAVPLGLGEAEGDERFAPIKPDDTGEFPAITTTEG
jgi:hypothetical protein